MPFTHPFRLTTFSALAILFMLCIAAVFVKLHFIGTTPSSDYTQYIATAHLFSGDAGADIAPQRILKPLNPLVVSGLSPLLSYAGAFMFQAVFFYFALAVAMYLLAYEFFADRLLAVFASVLVVLSYPILKYGVDLTTETGAIFFYVLSLWLTLRFLKEPRADIFFLNACVTTLGFLWKEYSIVSGAVFGLALLFHPLLDRTAKIKYIAWYAAIFLCLNIPWQVYVFLKYHYTYLSWYGQGGAPGFGYEFTLKNIEKSTAALLGLAWFAVPLGFRRFEGLERVPKLFLKMALPLPFIGYVWGFISSRLLYVMAPPFILLALAGMKNWKRPLQIALVSSTVVANVVWLFLSYSIKL